MRGLSFTVRSHESFCCVSFRGGDCVKTWKRDVLVPAGHPLYGKEYIDPRDFEGQHVVICANPMFYQHFLEFCQDNDCHPAEIIQVSDTLYMYETCSTEKYLGIAIDRYFTGAFSLQF